MDELRVDLLGVYSGVQGENKQTHTLFKESLSICYWGAYCVPYNRHILLQITEPSEPLMDAQVAFIYIHREGFKGEQQR